MTLFSNVYRFCRALISSLHFTIQPLCTFSNYIIYMLWVSTAAKSFRSTPFLPLQSFFDERPSAFFFIPLSAPRVFFSFFWPFTLATLAPSSTVSYFNPQKFTFDAQLFHSQPTRLSNFLFSEKNCLLSPPTYKKKVYSFCEKKRKTIFVKIFSQQLFRLQMDWMRGGKTTKNLTEKMETLLNYYEK